MYRVLGAQFLAMEEKPSAFTRFGSVFHQPVLCEHKFANKAHSVPLDAHEYLFAIEKPGQEFRAVALRTALPDHEGRTADHSHQPGDVQELASVSGERADHLPPVLEIVQRTAADDQIKVDSRSSGSSWK